MPSVTLTPEERIAALDELIELRLEAQAAQIPDEDAASAVDFLLECRIEDKETGALIPFDLWDAQRDIVQEVDECIASGDLEPIARILALKSRQLGMTWLFVGLLLYLGTFWGHRLFLILSQTGSDSQAAMHRLKVMRNSLPDKWRRPLVKDNMTEVAFTNGSRYRALKATKRAGRGEAAFALADEIATWSWPGEQLATLEPGCRLLWAVTTGQGPDDYTHKMWKNAKAGKGRWVPLFLPWYARPDRDENWYRDNVTEATEPRRAKREYAATPEDAFSSPAGVFFERFESQRNVQDITIVPNWPVDRAVDFGYHSPACTWIQTSPAGQPFVIAELTPHEKTTEEFIALIQDVDASLHLVIPPRATYCDPAGNATNVKTGDSEVDAMFAAGLSPVSTASSVRDGCVRLINHISHPVLPLIVSRACPWTIEAFTTVRPDKHRPDIYDEKSDYDHILDTLRYWSVNEQVQTVGTTSIAGFKSSGYRRRF